MKFFPMDLETKLQNSSLSRCSGRHEGCWASWMIMTDRWTKFWSFHFLRWNLRCCEIFLNAGETSGYQFVDDNSFFDISWRIKQARLLWFFSMKGEFLWQWVYNILIELLGNCVVRNANSFFCILMMFVSFEHQPSFSLDFNEFRSWTNFDQNQTRIPLIGTCSKLFCESINCFSW